MLQVSMLWFRSRSALVPWLCGLKDLFQFAEGLRAGESWLGRPGLTADRRVQHPEGHLQNSRWLDFFQAAMRHRLAALYQSCMHPHWPAVPWVPGIADFTNIPNMGVVLLSCTIKTVFTIPWERTRRIEGLWSRSQQRTQPSIPCPAWWVAPSLLLACGGVIINSSRRVVCSMNARDVVRLVLLSAPLRLIATCAPTSGVPLRVNCSCGTRKQVRGPRLSVRESVAVCRFGIGYSQWLITSN